MQSKRQKRYIEFTLILTLVLVSSTGFSGDMYIWVDEAGVKHYSAQPPANKKYSGNVQKKSIDYGKEVNLKSTVDRDDNCNSEYDNDSDIVNLTAINDNYDYRISRCDESFKSGTYQLRNCYQEKEEIRDESMKIFNQNKDNRCK